MLEMKTYINFVIKSDKSNKRLCNKLRKLNIYLKAKQIYAACLSVDDVNKHPLNHWTTVIQHIGLPNQ